MGFNLSYSTIFKFLNSENMDGEWCKATKPTHLAFSLIHTLIETLRRSCTCSNRIGSQVETCKTNKNEPTLPYNVVLMSHDRYV